MSFVNGCLLSVGLLLSFREVHGQELPAPLGDQCSINSDCASECCATLFPDGSNRRCLAPGSKASGDTCESDDGCDCSTGTCDAGSGLGSFMGMCTTGVYEDPHMDGLSGQKIDWAGVDGAWYSLIKDDDLALAINVRVNAPLPEDFPHRQLISGVAVVSVGHSVIVEFQHPYSTVTDGCPRNNLQCLIDGGVRIAADGSTAWDYPSAVDRLEVAEGIKLSASNLPVECWKFGGAKIWAEHYENLMASSRRLRAESFEEWILKSAKMSAPGWCAKYISEHESLLEVDSKHAILRIETPFVTVRINAGVNHQGDGEVDWDGRVLPELDFWQMDVGLEGLSVGDSITGLLGETARPVYDRRGKPIMRGLKAMRGTVEDYKVAGPLETDFALVNKKL